MRSMDRVTASIDDFFQQEKDPTMQKFADFGATVINSASISEILQEALDSPEQIQDIGYASYRISPNFLKLFLHRDQETGWGLRVHVFTPEEDGNNNTPLDEPWHEHRWNLASSVLKGSIHSENAFANLNPIPLSADSKKTEEEMYYYSVADKRIVGKIAPQLLGTCFLDDKFSLENHEGTTYAHHSQLAHHLSLYPQDGTTITSVITAPPNRTEAAFIEYEPLEFKERDSPTTLSPEATREAISLVLKELQTTTSGATKKPSNDSQSPFPAYLYQVR